VLGCAECFSRSMSVCVCPVTRPLRSSGVMVTEAAAARQRIGGGGGGGAK
jgi:hypothetical protein